MGLKPALSSPASTCLVPLTPPPRNLNANQLTTLPLGIFDSLEALTYLCVMLGGEYSGWLRFFLMASLSKGKVAPFRRLSPHFSWSRMLVQAGLPARLRLLHGFYRLCTAGIVMYLVPIAWYKSAIPQFARVDKHARLCMHVSSLLSPYFTLSYSRLPTERALSRPHCKGRGSLDTFSVAPPPPSVFAPTHAPAGPCHATS